MNHRRRVRRPYPGQHRRPCHHPRLHHPARHVGAHPGRCRNDAAFAALAGTSPIPASSGRITRHRLNRGGDRHLNAALHTIAVTRRRHHPDTRDYITRRTAEGRTLPEITRCLKRYIARQLYRLMQATATTT